MSGPNLFSDTMYAFERSLDFRSVRHNIVTTNISNADTPGFKAKDVRFESVLKRALEKDRGIALARTNPSHIEGGSGVDILSTAAPDIVKTDSPVASFDGNTVSVDAEMAKLSENSLLYQAETDVLARLFSGLRYAVSEGGNI
ncbi:MAG: flagellar basal body rod protein FlgB [Candidatus Tectomicrobia bacterium]|uniref:Flagellar basal body rod protein FlgB n=1 Tax=Tectimicrobiota bacterium TaxID=2528274 RepID=A0A932I1H5_UNCTE|nr:flagellar basal body rod protein FlgB [Candidatus Tectomicrobia bacterium]